MLGTIVIIIVALYLITSIVVYFLANSNIIPSRRRKEYEIGFTAEKKYLSSALNPSKKVAYWVAEQDDSSKTVILLHGFTRTSDKLQSRAEIYWNRGYSLYFVDNLGHGYSSDQLYPSGYRYTIEVKNLIDTLNIDHPVIHGLSMGAIAANVLAQLYPDIPSAIICEALPANFDNLYKELLRYIKVPHFLFPWIEWVSRKFNWKQFEELGLDEHDYHPAEISCPIFLIHSQSDPLFHYEEHFLPLVSQFEERANFKSWLVPDSGHTNMVENDQYEDQLTDFLATVNTQ